MNDKLICIPNDDKPLVENRIALSKSLYTTTSLNLPIKIQKYFWAKEYNYVVLKLWVPV